MQLATASGPVHLADWGSPFDPARPTVLWLHGAGMDHTVWTLQARAKAFQGMNSLALDLAGHGRSGGMACATIGDWAAWLRGVLDGLGVGACGLAGHSMGALIALETAAGDARVQRLALLAAAPKMPVHPDLLRAAEEELPAAAAMIADWGIGGAAKLTGGGTPGVSLVASAQALVGASRPGVLAADLAACNAYSDAEARAAAVTCPALVLCGTQDRMTPARAGQKLAGLIRDARCVTVPAGHMMMLERPKPVLEALAGFLG